MVAPSLLSADFTRLGEEVAMINRSEADWLHLDVMDGMFVPNISFGFPVIEAVSRISTKPLDVHLMIEQPERYISQVAEAGAMMMNVHVEAVRHLDRVIHQIHEADLQAGVTLCPATPLNMVEEVLPLVDMVLIMGVNPGFSGQSFIPNTVERVRRLRQMMDERQCSPLIQVDGGVTDRTAPQLVEAGADVLVAGSFVFGTPNPEERIRQLKMS